jgi:hypothetical protein
MTPDYYEEDERVKKHLLEAYDNCYWCYLQDKDRTESFKIEDVVNYISDLVSLEHVINFFSAYDQGIERCRKVRESRYAKHRIAYEMKPREYKQPWGL